MGSLAEDISSASSPPASPPSSHAEEVTDESPSMDRRRSERIQIQSVLTSPGLSLSASCGDSSSEINEGKSEREHPPCAPRKCVKRPRRSTDPIAEAGDEPEHAICDDASEEEENRIAALTERIRAGHQQFLSVSAVSVDFSLSNEALSSLLLALSGIMKEETSSGDALAGMRSCSMDINLLVQKSQVFKMFGYFFRAVIAFQLRRRFGNKKYGAKLREVLGVKGAADTAAYPAFYCVIEKYYPEAVSLNSLESLLRIPLFAADMSWHEWRDLLTKNQIHIIHAAMERFLESIAPFKDWLDRELVEVFDHPQYGKGVKALKDIPLERPSAIAADFATLPERKEGQGSEYIMTVKGKELDCSEHWIGKLNHRPHSKCNMKTNSEGKLIQIESIAKGEELFIDYGVEFWVYQVTGIDWDTWMDASTLERDGLKKIFGEMLEEIEDYRDLLAMKISAKLSNRCTALDKEDAIYSITEYVRNFRDRRKVLLHPMTDER
jgi:hypothetical protein